MDTQPSMPLCAVEFGPEKIGRPAQVLQRQLDEQVLSPDIPAAAFWRMPLSYAPVLPIASSKIVGFEVSPVTENCSI